jgi:branched-chain amino acid transport system substrate-binding protein
MKQEQRHSGKFALQIYPESGQAISKKFLSDKVTGFWIKFLSSRKRAEEKLFRNDVVDRAALLLASLFLFVVCFSSPARADVVIGLAGPLTGQYAAIGEQLRRGAEQAVADINAAGGINGEKLVLRAADDACDPKQAVIVANRFASDGVKFVVGHFCSGSSIPASKVYSEEGMMMVSPGSTNPALTDAGYPTIFRVCGRDDQQGSIDGLYIVKHFPGQKIAIVHDNSTAGRGQAEEVKKAINAAGVKETLFDSYVPGQRDYSSLISKFKQNGIQVLFIGGYYTEAALIARQINDQGAKIQIVGGDGLVTDDFWSIAGPAAEGVLMSFNPDPRKKPEAQAALSALRKSGYEPEGYTLYSYAAAQAVAEGIRRAGKSDPAKASAAIKQSPVKTVVGPLAFDAKGDVAGSNYVLYRWHDGKYAEAGD